ncbi:MAG: hypothetical protein ACK5X3_09525 [Pseudomonadota bacterium]|jgi:hypothetical protein
MSDFKPLEPRNLGSYVDAPTKVEPDYKELYESNRHTCKMLAKNCLMWLDFKLETYDDPKVRDQVKKAKNDMEKFILSL